MLLAPAVWGWSTQPVPYKTALWLVAHVTPRLNLEPPNFISSTVYASDNLDELRAMGRDRLMLWGARADAIYGLVNLMQTASTGVARIKVPTLYLSGAHDELVPAASMLQAAHRLPAGDRTGYYAKGWHLLLVDRQAPAVWADVASYIRNSSAPAALGRAADPEEDQGKLGSFSPYAHRPPGLVPGVH